MLSFSWVTEFLELTGMMCLLFVILSSYDMLLSQMGFLHHPMRIAIQPHVLSDALNHLACLFTAWKFIIHKFAFPSGFPAYRICTCKPCCVWVFMIRFSIWDSILEAAGYNPPMPGNLDVSMNISNKLQEQNHDALNSDIKSQPDFLTLTTLDESNVETYGLRKCLRHVLTSRHNGIWWPVTTEPLHRVTEFADATQTSLPTASPSPMPWFLTPLKIC